MNKNRKHLKYHLNIFNVNKHELSTMKYCHNIKISVFAKIDEGENEILIQDGLKKIVPFELEKEKIKIEQQTAKGFEEKRIRIFEVNLTKDRHINQFLEHLMKTFSSEQKALLLRQLDSRLDEEQNFFIRIDKEKFLNDCTYFITDYGNCYHIRFSIACFPKLREKATEIVKEILAM